MTDKTKAAGELRISLKEFERIMGKALQVKPEGTKKAKPKPNAARKKKPRR